MEVAVVEPHGDQNIVYLRPTGQTEAETLLHAVIGGTDDPDPGTRVAVDVAPETVHVFDANTGEALHNRRLDPETEVTHV